MEKLFFSITRWLMLIGATMAFVFLIGGGIYAFKLYKTSRDTQTINGNIYQAKEPEVSFFRKSCFIWQKSKHISISCY